MEQTQVWFLAWEDPLEKEMAAHSSVLVWEIPQTEEPGGLQFMGLWKSQIWLSDCNNSNDGRCLSENLHGRIRNPGTWLSSLRKAQASLPLFQTNFLWAFVCLERVCASRKTRSSVQGVGEAGNGVPVPSVTPVSLCATLHPWLAFKISVVLQARWAK